MYYSPGEIQRRIGERRKRFLATEISLGLLTVGGATVASLYYKDIMISFFGAMAVIVGIAVFIRVWNKSRPGILFCREMRGVDIAENEYVAMRYSGVGRYSRWAGSTVIPRRGESSGSNYRPRGLKGTVYLRLDNGDVDRVTDLPVAYTDFYEEGDSILRYSGTKYPIVIGREVDRQPCPICGRFNTPDLYACRSCDLPIEKGQMAE